MDAFPFLVHYNGLWAPDNTFQNYVAEGVVLPENNSYDMLHNVLANHLMIDKSTTELKIQFQLKEGLVPMNITNDMNVAFYMQMRNSVGNAMNCPLCVTMLDKANKIVTHDHQLHVDSEELSKFPYEPIEDAPLDMFDYVHQLTHQIMDDLDKTIRTEYDNLGKEDEGTLITDKKFKNFQEGQIFINKSTLQSSLSFYAIEEHFQFRTERSSQQHYFLKCVDKSCCWTFRACRSGNSSAFKIKKIVNRHSCDLVIRCSGKRQATRKLIGEVIKMKYVQVKSIYTPADIIQDMRTSYGININYQKAWNSKEKALELIRGKSTDSYALLPSYLYMLQQTIHGTVIELKREVTNAFLYVFVAFKASIDGWKFCWPTVVVDGTFLKASHGGTLITACTQDASGAIFPLAFCVVDSENDLSWEWFFTRFRETYGTRNGMSFVSDRHESIAKGLAKVYPDLDHYACIYHLKANLKSKFRKDPKNVGTYFMRAAKSYTIAEFEMNMCELDGVDKEIRVYLNNVGFKRWARCFQYANMSYNLTSNIAESMNDVNKAARELPITSLLEQLRDLTQEWFVKNRLVAISTATKLAKRHEDTLKKNYFDAEKYEVKESNYHVHKVSVGKDVYVVDMTSKTCSCNCFQVDGIPCSHAVAVTCNRYIDAYLFCSEYFTKAAMVATYEGSIFPIPKEETWEIPSDVKDMIVHPPYGRNKAGRPKKRRFKSAWETKSQIRCSNCGKKGHNKKTCRNRATCSDNI